MRTWREALRFTTNEIKHGEPFGIGLCKMKTREAYLIPTDGSQDAAEAWSRTRHRFHGLWIPGGLIWWTGGTPDPQTGRRRGHVAQMGWRKGRIRSVDYPRTHHWNNTTVAELEKAWPRLEFAGTSLDIDGKTVRAMPRIIRRWSHS
jgi:hypothetical protein